MTQSIAWLDGDFLPLAEARIPVTDRGFLFADAVYEVTAVIDGHLVDADAHMARLFNSLSGIGIAAPWSASELLALQWRLAVRNGLREGLVYLQVTRGSEPGRGFVPNAATRPTLVAFVEHRALRAAARSKTGLSVVTCPDLRWARREIKSTALLAQVLAKQLAAAQGADEAWMIEDGYVTEGASSTAYIVTRSGEVITTPLDSNILPGITRAALIERGAALGLAWVEKRFTLAEALTAREAFGSGAGMLVRPVTSIDGTPIGDGRPGPVVRALLEAYLSVHKPLLATDKFTIANEQPCRSGAQRQ